MTSDASPAPTLRKVLEAAAANLESVVGAEAPAGGLEWSIDGRVFATIAGTRAEFRLDRMVAAAALRTPDTSSSVRGRDWVAFEPVELDGHAVDRAEAWLASAWRRADGEA